MKKIIVLLLVLLMAGCSSIDIELEQEPIENTPVQEPTTNDPVIIDDTLFSGYTEIEVDGGNQSGYREANVVVDIGFGDREYYAFTNEYGQLIKVVAEEIVLQDEENEPVLSTGRYYSDEAKVPGVESPYLDEGHVIADSLGGVANAYNITPQNSTMNRHGDQAYMEKVIRDAGGCTNFVAIITYPDTETQIPSHYHYSYTLKGEDVVIAFDNVNPDEVNEEIIDKEKLPESVVIFQLDKVNEFVVILNNTNEAVDLTGWKILSVRGEQEYTFDTFTLPAMEEVRIGDSERTSNIDFHWMEGSGVWNNSNSDPAELYNALGELVYRFED